MTNNKIVEITSLDELMELASMSGGAVSGHSNTRKKKRTTKMISREQIVKEQILRKLIRQKIKESLNKKPPEEQVLRDSIRQIIAEGDLSDVHPNRSTGINMLEDVLKKSIPTLRTDYKRLTTDKRQRESFRAHIIKAVKDAIMPEMVKGSYGIGTGGDASALLSEPAPAGEETEEFGGEEEVDAFAELEEADIEVEIDDEDKKIPVEDDDTPSPEEEFGSGLEAMDETGRNMAYTSFRKISQYVLDAYDSLANPKDKEIFLDYLVTNLKLYFDKFEDELSSSVEEPTTSEYDSIKNA